MIQFRPPILVNSNPTSAFKAKPEDRNVQEKRKLTRNGQENPSEVSKLREELDLLKAAFRQLVKVYNDHKHYMYNAPPIERLNTIDGENYEIGH